MSENEQTQKSSIPMPTVMRSGEEPTELLLRLVWSPVETLQERGIVRIFVGNGRVAIILKDTHLLPDIGLVPTQKEIVGEPADEA